MRRTSSKNILLCSFLKIFVPQVPPRGDNPRGQGLLVLHHLARAAEDPGRGRRQAVRRRAPGGRRPIRGRYSNLHRHRPITVQYCVYRGRRCRPGSRGRGAGGRGRSWGRSTDPRRTWQTSSWRASLSRTRWWWWSQSTCRRSRRLNSERNASTKIFLYLTKNI